MRKPAPVEVPATPATDQISAAGAGAGARPQDLPGAVQECGGKGGVRAPGT